MAEYIKTIDAERNLTVIRVVGDLILEEIEDAVIEFYANDPTPNLIWDMTQANAQRLSTDDIKRIITYSRPRSGTRARARTAFVLGDDLEFGLSRMYGSLAAAHRLPVAIGTYRSMDEAMAWITTNDDDTDQT